jgi:NhaA family Na+:H+ antiporter
MSCSASSCGSACSGRAVGLLLPTSSRLSEGLFAERVQAPVDRFKEAHAAAEETDDPAIEEEERDNAQRRLGYIHEMAAATDEAAERLVRVLTPWVSYIVLPLFAISNVRIHFSADLVGEALRSPLSAGVVVGLVLGKPLGFLGATWLATRLGRATLPEGVTWPMVLGIGGVAGIGFTISLFIAELAFADVAQTEQASLGILVASVLSGLFGYVIFWRTASAKSD